MSLMRTLAKAALGIAVAKGISSMSNRSRQPEGSRSGGGLLGGLAGAANRGGATGGGLGGMLGSVLSGRSQQAPGGGDNPFGQSAGGSRGGLGGMLESLQGASRGGQGPGASRGGLEGMLGGLLGGGAAAGGASGGLSGMLGQLAGQAPRPQGQPEADFGEVLNSSFDPERQDIPPTPEQEAAAGLMLRAMIQAIKSDGHIDDAERERLMDQLEDISPDEQRFVQEEMRKPVDPEGLARDTPSGLEAQVYAMALMAIDLDSREEAEFLHRLAQGMRLERSDVDAIHQRLNAPSLYS